MIMRAVIALFVLSVASSANAETVLGPGSSLAECVTIKYRDTPVCLNTFTCSETPQSSFVRQICYDATKSYMLIKLNDTWYHYCAVDRLSADNLIRASSVGTYYNQHFRSQGLVHGPASYKEGHNCFVGFKTDIKLALRRWKDLYNKRYAAKAELKEDKGAPYFLLEQGLFKKPVLVQIVNLGNGFVEYYTYFE